MRKQVKLRIRSLLREERCKSTESAWSKAWFAWLDQVQLPEQSRWVINEEREQLQRLEEDIRRAEKRMQEVLAEDAVPQQLLKQPGIGLVTAVTLRAEIGRFDRFRSGKQLAKYCGVTPCNRSSGKHEADAGLINQCNRELRAVIIQAAQRLPRHVDRWKQLKLQLTKRKPANVATAAIANRWLRWLFHQMQPNVSGLLRPWKPEFGISRETQVGRR